ncbi:2-amino-4-hydroxy-6-hydroxymethyldihydropteridine diphosphokinase [Tateyamaria pelophila]|uniref:2-amino-4-hydroxy-6- hydroxymethyldihydropteridine diphosphokinase n=1 Tax=Tateyamaria pelophila TaxID=328415 RepID=UPI0029587168|nr:2-amino-4-hydroxy-6-hydroxymethyldihydropteridine diphosphokinase [Tateyamaria pelophila]
MSQDTFAEKNGELPPQRRSEMLVAVGSNMDSTAGNPRETIRAGVELIVEAGGVIRTMSHFYSTPAFPAGSGPDYVNAALAISAPWSPQEALTHLHAVEAALGRRRKARWEQRALDLDLLACGDMVSPDEETVRAWMDMPLSQQKTAAPQHMILPHPRLHERAFVLVPLADVAPGWVHPVLGQTVKQLLALLPAADIEQIKALD